MARPTYFLIFNFCIGLVVGLLLSSFAQDYYRWNTVRYLGSIGQNHRRDIGLNASQWVETETNHSEVPGPHRTVFSHTDIESSPQRDSVIEFKDKGHHHDDDSVAKDLYNNTRILVWIMTSPQNLRKKARHVKATWSKRFNKAIFVSDEENKNFPTVAVKVPHGRDHLTQKTMAAFDYVYKNHFNDADWFMKADDDTYVIAENLRYMLSTKSADMPVYYGHHFKPLVKQGYFSGGGGYVLSREALRRFAKRKPEQCLEKNGVEDVEFGRCMESLGVITGDSRDKLGRTRFHCFSPDHHIHGTYPKWYYSYNKYNATKGPESISDYAVSFHYITPQQMYTLEFYIYHLRPYGIRSGDQDIN